MIPGECVHTLILQAYHVCLIYSVEPIPGVTFFIIYKIKTGAGLFEIVIGIVTFHDCISHAHNRDVSWGLHNVLFLFIDQDVSLSLRILEKYIFWIYSNSMQDRRTFLSRRENILFFRLLRYKEWMSSFKRDSIGELSMSTNYLTTTSITCRANGKL